jgi:assimilatory nitrate reductase catalytic subunit
MFRAVGEGRIRALWIMATNPAVSLPDATEVRKALARCPFLVVSDCTADTDTAKFADVLLPASAWGEKGGTVTNSERCISRQRAFLPEAGEAKPDWWIVTQVAQRMGYADAFAYRKPADIFREHAALSSFENNGTRAFDIGALAGIGDEAYEAMQPVQWPVTPHRRTGTPRLFEDRRFFTPDRRARFVAVGASSPAQTTSTEFPFALNTGRIRDQWHTMTRTGLAPRLTRHICEPFLAMNPDDATALDLHDGMLARMRSARGEGIFRLCVDGGQPRGTLFAPIHWSDETAANALVAKLIAAIVDPISGQPEFKHTPVAVEPVVTAWRGFFLGRDEAPSPKTTYWARVRVEGGVLYEFAEASPGVAPPTLETWVGEAADGGERLEAIDPRRGRHCTARLEGERLTHCLFVAREGALPARDWLVSLLAKDRIADADRAMLLAGRRADTRVEEGHVVCSCFGIGATRIADAIARHGLATVDDVGEMLKAGTNCGSCRPEIRALIVRTTQRDAA